MSDPNPQGPLRSEFATDPEMSELIGLFLSELPAKIEGVVAAFQGGDADTLKRLAHQIKGAAGGYGFPSVGDAAGKVELGLKAASDPQAALAKVNADVRELVELCCRAADSTASSSPARPRW
jgi:HPt (histidine-containing phosphotransfer) domain-containing protein